MIARHPMLEELKKDVCDTNRELVTRGLVMQTFGNASGVDRDGRLMVTKPSGIDYRRMRLKQMIAVSMDTGKVVEGHLNPSSDTPTHLAFYRAFESIRGVIHTHNLYATSWAQAHCEIPALGTTHADYFHGPISCTPPTTAEEIQTDYEANTRHVIVERFSDLDPLSYPGVLVAGHGPFTWGATVMDAVDNAEILGYLAKLASETIHNCPNAQPMQRVLLEKHIVRKHGKKDEMR
jgi:L-ribulose-5-phosphate 4-epimerase